MHFPLFDLHCDTAYEMYRQKQGLTRNNLAISLENAEIFPNCVQVMALWTDYRLSNEEGWDACKKMYLNLISDSAIKSNRAMLVTQCPVLPMCKNAFFLGIEDARIFNGDEMRVDTLWNMGVRFLTPLWKGETCIGGSHDTEVGLTDFGKRAIDRALKRGMILDISHASERSAKDIFEIAAQHGRPVIATHSNAYDVCPVSRNLRRWQVEEILHCNGVVGLNLYPSFLRYDKKAVLADLLPHIDYFLELGLEHNLCLGCDMDGADMPPEIQTVADLERLAELLLAHCYSESFVNALFFANAYRFASINL
ncbi:MAG: membrane dipeptidase [Clostridia bacterium]|nr:membrane dipeptidase [Clostridia bacterium]